MSVDFLTFVYSFSAILAIIGKMIMQNLNLKFVFDSSGS